MKAVKSTMKAQLITRMFFMIRHRSDGSKSGLGTFTNCRLTSIFLSAVMIQLAYVNSPLMMVCTPGCRDVYFALQNSATFLRVHFPFRSINSSYKLCSTCSKIKNNGIDFLEREKHAKTHYVNIHFYDIFIYFYFQHVANDL